MEAALLPSSQEQNFWCQGCLCLTGCSQQRLRFDMERASGAYLIFLASLEVGISLGGPRERSLWQGTRGSGLSLDPFWSSVWSFLACIGLKEQSLPWTHDQGAQSRLWGARTFNPQTWSAWKANKNSWKNKQNGFSHSLTLVNFHMPVNGGSLFPCGLKMSNHLDALTELQALINYFKLRGKKNIKVKWKVRRWQAPREIQVVSGWDSLKYQKHLQVRKIYTGDSPLLLGAWEHIAMGILMCLFS